MRQCGNGYDANPRWNRQTDRAHSGRSGSEQPDSPRNILMLRPSPSSVSDFQAS